METHWYSLPWHILTAGLQSSWESFAPVTTCHCQLFVMGVSQGYLRDHAPSQSACGLWRTDALHVLTGAKPSKENCRPKGQNMSILVYVCMEDNKNGMSVAGLTVLLVDASSRDFVHDHVFRTAWEAALHTVTLSWQRFQSIDRVSCKWMLLSSEAPYWGRNWQRVASGSLHVWTQGLAQAW